MHWNDEAHQIIKNPIIILTFLKTFPALYCAFKNKANITVAAAFIFCGIGDMLLQLDGHTMKPDSIQLGIAEIPTTTSKPLPSLFIHGLLSFLLAHLLFIHSFGTLKQVVNDLINIEIFTITSYLLVLGAVMILWSSIAADTTTMQVAVPLYGLVLATLMNRSYALYQKSSNSTAAKLVTIGTVMFTVSDVLIVFDKYKILSLSSVEREIAVMSTYFCAISLISMINTTNDKTDDTNNNDAAVFAIGTTVNVESRMTPGMNAPGGVARITKINQDGTYNLKYVMGGSESNVESMYIKEQVFTDTISGAIKKRSTRRRTSSRGRTSTPTKTKTKSSTKSKAGSIKKKKAVAKNKNVKYTRTTTLVEATRHPETDKDVSLVLRPKHRTSSSGRTSTPTKTKTKSNTKSNTKSKAVSIKKKKKTVQTPKSSPSKKWINHLPKIGRMVDWKFGKDWWTGVVTNIDADFVTVNYIVDDGDDEDYQHKVQDCWPKAGRWRYHKAE